MIIESFDLFREKMTQAYDFALDKVGLDVYAFTIWNDYVAFLKSVYVDTFFFIHDCCLSFKGSDWFVCGKSENRRCTESLPTRNYDTDDQCGSTLERLLCL